MKRDVQVGVTLGVIILAIIGVFLSTRTSVKEPSIPIPEAEEEAQIGALDISELSPDLQSASRESLQETTTSLQGTDERTEQKASVVTNTMKIDEQTAEKEDNRTLPIFSCFYESIFICISAKNPTHTQ